MNRVVLFGFIFYLFIISYLNAQLSYKINYEGGFFRNSGNELINKNDFLTRFDGQINFLDEQDNKNISGEIRIRPELYGFKNNFKTLKLRAKGDFYKYEDKFTWGVNFAVQRNFYRSSLIELEYDNLFLSGDFSLILLENVSLNLIPGYAYQRINSNGTRNLDIIFMEAKLEKIWEQYLQTGCGIYVEKFSIENKLEFTTNALQNNGWRIGPSVNLKYLRDFILNTEYRFVMHYSDVTNIPSYEQSVRLVIGKIILPDWSVFLLIDYYFRRFLLKKNLNEINSTIYAPMNFENRFYLKTSYDFTEYLEGFLKYGYSKENLEYIKYSLVGWSLTAGMEFNW